MKRDPIILLIAAAFAVLLALTAASTFPYLMRGYSLSVGIEGVQPKDYHVDFPPTRIAIAALIWALGFAAIALFIVGDRRAGLLSWGVFISALLVAVWDVFEYGTMGSPTSLWVLLVFLLLALATQFRSRFDRAAN